MRRHARRRETHVGLAARQLEDEDRHESEQRAEHNVHEHDAHGEGDALGRDVQLGAVDGGDDARDGEGHEHDELGRHAGAERQVREGSDAVELDLERHDRGRRHEHRDGGEHERDA
ncbi:hypothetical protein ON010_g16315 [Phytophthora cinnamomi]|nr:hypothetical protein ON010_g16315 [Phytophthora cinnamomi]